MKTSARSARRRPGRLMPIVGLLCAIVTFAFGNRTDLAIGVPGQSNDTGFLLLTQGLPQPGQTWAPAKNPLWFSTETAVKFYGERMGHALAR